MRQQTNKAESAAGRKPEIAAKGGDDRKLPNNIQAYYDPKSASFWIPAEHGWMD